MEIIIPIILAVVVFSVLILFMSAGLISARKKLLPQGDVKIKVNGEKTFEAKPGGTLLGVLSSQSVFLPSACGGGGTCAMCRCQVDTGGGDILPTELNHISRKDAQDNWRLACQVKVRGDMEIRVPEEIFGIQKWECTVVSNYNVASFIKEFVVRLPEGEEMNFDPGGYIQIDVPKITVDYKNIDIEAHPEHHGDDPNKFQDEWDTYKLWDLQMVNEEPQFRAYSMANHPAEGNIVMLNILSLHLLSSLSR